VNGVRSFVGLSFDDVTASALMTGCAAIRAADPLWKDEKWVVRENLHVTIGFIGDVPQEELASLAAGIADSIRSVAPFDLSFDRFFAKPDARRASMVWASFLDPSGACTDLAAVVECASLPFGAQPRTRPFAPHATIVRARKPKRIDTRALAAGVCAPDGIARMSVHSATLFASQLTPRRPVYSVVAELPLLGSADR
jgi:2'-5' RNA ligase